MVLPHRPLPALVAAAHSIVSVHARSASACFAVAQRSALQHSTSEEAAVRTHQHAFPAHLALMFCFVRRIRRGRGTKKQQEGLLAFAFVQLSSPAVALCCGIEECGGVKPPPLLFVCTYV
jgi:hypothetical protein